MGLPSPRSHDSSMATSPATTSNSPARRRCPPPGPAKSRSPTIRSSPQTRPLRSLGRHRPRDPAADRSAVHYRQRRPRGIRQGRRPFSPAPADAFQRHQPRGLRQPDRSHRRWHRSSSAGVHRRRSRNRHGCTIHSGVRILDGCKIGADCTLFPNAVLYENTILGQQVIIHAGAVLGDWLRLRIVRRPPQALLAARLRRSRRPRRNRRGTTIDRGTYGPTVIGSGTKIDNLVQIGHNCRIGRHNLICSQVGIAGSCTTGEYVVMAGQVGLADHLHIGDGAMLGAKCGVMTDVPPASAISATRRRRASVFPQHLADPAAPRNPPPAPRSPAGHHPIGGSGEARTRSDAA